MGVRLLVLVLISCLLSSCSFFRYDLPERKRIDFVIPDNARSIYVPIFKIEKLSVEKSNEMLHDVPAVLTEYVRKELVRQKRLVLESKKQNADLVVQGVVKEFKLEPWSYSLDGTNLIQDILVRIRVSLTLLDLKNGAVLFEDVELERSQLIYVRGSWEPRMSAVYQLSELISDDIFLLLLGQSL